MSVTYSQAGKVHTLSVQSDKVAVDLLELLASRPRYTIIAVSN